MVLNVHQFWRLGPPLGIRRSGLGPRTLPPERIDATLRGYSESIGQRMERDLDALLPLPPVPYDAGDGNVRARCAVEALRQRIDLLAPHRCAKRTIRVYCIGSELLIVPVAVASSR